MNFKNFDICINELLKQEEQLYGLNNGAYKDEDEELFYDAIDEVDKLKLREII